MNIVGKICIVVKMINKWYKLLITDSPPLLIIQQLVLEQVPSRNNLTIGRYIMETNIMYKNGIPQFDGHNYALWSIRMKIYVQAHGFDVWKSIINGYKYPATPPIDNNGNKLSQNNLRAKIAILNGLVDSVYVKVMHCNSTKEIWDKLRNVYEGYAKVKAEKIQTYRGQFEKLKMKEDENIAAYFLRVDETVNAINGLGEEVDESIIVQKVLRSLPTRFEPKISTLEEREDLSTISMDELHGIFTAYEMRMEHENPVTKETTFKSSKKTKKKRKSKCSCNDDLEEDEETTNFVIKLHKGTCKYKGKLLLKCFNCGKVGHFANKCPYVRNSDGDEEEYPKKEKKYQKGNKKDKRNAFKKSLYSREDSSSSDEDDETDRDS
jgi:hypothetical protein